MCVYARRWFPGRKIDENCLAEAMFLERDFWRHWEKLLGAE
ncbi:MAG: hypothetical protein AB7F40_10385 [Victivallaceae bacterium]|nr:hypothetical protein [Victivallaceae bacterium]